jgi:general secretion pathway protein H
VRWRATPGGFRFEGAASLPQQWLAPGVQVADPAPLLLGPEPMIAPQSVVLTSPAAPGIALRIATDGVRPFQLAGE